MPRYIFFRTIFVLSFFLSLFPAAWGAPAPEGSSEILLKGVHIVDPAHAKISNGNILLRRGRIVSLGDVPPGFKGKVMDLSGKWVLPGLVDAHAHTSWGNQGIGMGMNMSTEESARHLLFAGVTAVLDLFADEDEIFHYREKSRQNDWVGATVYAAGPMLTCSNGHGTEFGIRTRTMDNPAEAKKQVDALAARKPDVVKLAYDHAREYLSMNRATMRAVIAEARRLHLRTVVHIGTWQDAREAVQAGATVITHLHEDPIPDDLVKLMHTHGVWEIPTMTYQTELVHALENRSWMDSPLLGAMVPNELLMTFKPVNLGSVQLQKEILWERRGLTTYYATLKKLSDGGVPLMTGTDAGGGLAVFQGFSVHREMQILVEAGLTPWQALAAGTSNPRKFLGRKSGIGRGELADFVVLNGSPVDNIANTQQIDLVFHDGNLVNRAGLISHRTLTKYR